MDMNWYEAQLFSLFFHFLVPIYPPARISFSGTPSAMYAPKKPLYHLLHLLVFLSLFAGRSSQHLPGHGPGLVVAQKKLSFFRRTVPDPKDATAEFLEQQQVAALKGLSSNRPSAEGVENKDKKQKDLSKGKSVEDLLSVVAASSPPSPPGSNKSGSTIANKKPTGHEDDIVHEHDHADNDAYDDIVWYDGPHRDDEDEHGHEGGHYDDDHHEDHHDDYHEEDRRDESDDKVQQVQFLKQDPGVLSNLPMLNGMKRSAESGSRPEKQGPGTVGLDAQLIFKGPHQHDHSDHDDNAPPGVFQHSGADIFTGTISAKEFCLRLKHECESTCREFRSGVEHLSITCETGGVAELLFWGKCCQIGQEHRTRKLATKMQANLAKQNLQWQQKRHQAQRLLERQRL